jgi:hypothetical protein
MDKGGVEGLSRSSCSSGSTCERNSTSDSNHSFITTDVCQFKKHYYELQGQSSQPAPDAKRMKKIKKVLATSDDKDAKGEPAPAALRIDTCNEWEAEYNLYINGVHILSDGIRIVEWWGVSNQCISL